MHTSRPESQSVNHYATEPQDVIEIEKCELYFSLAMDNSLFSAVLSPILTRSCAVRSSNRRASNFLRSSTPLRGSTANTQRPAGQKVQKKSAGGVHTAAKPVRKRKAHTDGIGEKNEKRALSTAATGRNDRLTSATTDRSRHIDSLTGKLQQQKREVTDVWSNACPIDCTSVQKLSLV